jgi:hypothetical protein
VRGYSKQYSLTLPSILPEIRTHPCLSEALIGEIDKTVDFPLSSYIIFFMSPPSPSGEAVSQFRSWLENLTTNGIRCAKINHLAIRHEPFDSPFTLRLSKGERFAQDRLVEGRMADYGTVSREEGKGEGKF